MPPLQPHPPVAARVPAGSPAVAGFQPLGLAIALAACFGGSAALAQPSGAQAIHGAATLSPSGSRLTVTTQNGPGTSHSAINWQSFSIPAGSSTHFAQPGAGSTSINRVVGPHPSAIFGHLSSNGRLVLVNPSGIAVGAGAVVDTAGFTASTLRMSDADALAGRLRFGDGGAAGPLAVNGHVIARGGDVVLIAPDVQTGAQALVQSVGGDTVLAAGQKVELTGRGLEGIRLELKAPGDRAINLGRLQGDSVGLFASQLRHSGLIQAASATAQGGKVVLRAQGEAVVDGPVQATQAGKGGAIDVFGERVAVVGAASLDASGAEGGGQIRVGGDYQGANAAVPNAKQTVVASTATVSADASVRGDGGRVIVWADDATRMDGSLSARGGAHGGNGGFAEVSGKRQLAFGGTVNLRSPWGLTGTLLLDPEDIVIGTGSPPAAPVASPPPGAYQYGGTGGTTSYLSAGTLGTQLATSNVLVKTASGSIRVTEPVAWSSANALALDAYQNIEVNAPITAANGQLALISSGVTAGGNISQTTGQVVHVKELILGTTTGIAGLNQAANKVGSLAANVGSLHLTNADALHITSLSNPLVAGTADGIKSGGGVFITAGGSITASSTLGTYGGAVSLQANGASSTISFNDISTNLFDGSVGVAGGSVMLNAGHWISGTSIQTQGRTGSIDGVGKDGGAITLMAGGDISVATGIASFGSAGTLGSTSGGLGGNVNITSTGGQVSLSSLNATGGSGATGRTGGTIIISAVAAAAGPGVSLGSVNVSGGSSSAAGVAGGLGGNVTVVTNQNLAFGTISAAGGSAGPGVGGMGGQVRLSSSSSTVTGVTVAAYGGMGASGGNGGHIHLQAPSQNFSVSNMMAYGGMGTSLAGGTGGVVITDSAWGSGTPDIKVYGGSGGFSTGDGGAGGAGGQVAMNQTGTQSMYLAGWKIDARGGTGGYGSGTGSSGGAGGAGGHVLLSAGSFSSSSGTHYQLLASAGDGGYGSGIAATSNGGNGGEAGAISLVALNNAGYTSYLHGTLGAAGGTGGNVNLSGSGLGGSGGAGGFVGISMTGTTAPLIIDGLVSVHGGFAGAAAPFASPAPSPAVRQGSQGALGSLSTMAGAGVAPTTGLTVTGNWLNFSKLTVPSAAPVSVQGQMSNHGSLLLLGNLTVGSGSGALVNTGSVMGTGHLYGSLVNSGVVAPGDPTAKPPIGILTVHGDFTQSGGGALQIDALDVTTPVPGVDYDQLKVVGGTARLGGSLVITAPAPTVSPTPAPASGASAGGMLPMAIGDYNIIDGTVDTTTAFTSLSVSGSSSMSSRLAVGGGAVPVAPPPSGGGVATAPTPAPTAAPAPSPTPVPSPTPSPSPSPSPSPTPAPSPTPSPTPAPSSAPVVDKIVELLRNEVTREAVQEAVAAQENVVTTFVALLIKEEAAQAASNAADPEKKKKDGDIVSTDTQCKP